MGGKLSKREFLMLAQEYEPAKHNVARWYMSIKLDGQRAFWDGGVSRGLLATEVPYANTAKDGRFIEPPRATGLWSRYGKVIHAPAEWLDALPVGMNLDMELWMGNNTFQLLRTITGSITPCVESWRSVVGYVLDAPGWNQVLQDGELTGPNWQGWLDRSMLAWVEKRSKVTPWRGLGLPDEAFRAIRQARALSEAPLTWVVHGQERLPLHPDDAREAVERALTNVTLTGGEGLILRRDTGPWVPKRSWDVLKVKKLRDAEAIVTGFTWGRETDKGSRHLGRMGALVTSFNGKRLELSGFTDEEREVRHRDGWVADSATEESIARAGKDGSKDFYAEHFPIGSLVTFTYRELTDDGIPKEARYARKRAPE